MTAPIQRGNVGPQLQKQTVTSEISRGSSYSEAWRGLSTTQMIDKWNSTILTAREGKISWGQGVAEMEITWAGSPGGQGASNSLAVTTDRWETPEPRSEKPIVQHPAMLYLFELIATNSNMGFSDGTVAALIAQFQKGIENNYPALDMTDASGGSITGWIKYQNFPGISVLTSDQLNYFIRMYRLCLAGATHYQTSQYALRHTTLAPNYWSLNVADLNVNAIYTPAQFISEVSNGSLFYFPLPGRLNYKLSLAVASLIARITASYGSIPANYQVGWLKSASSESTVAHGNIEIQTTYTLDLWSTDVYLLAS
jgi:hypothetical protein